MFPKVGKAQCLLNQVNTMFPKVGKAQCEQ